MVVVADRGRDLVKIALSGSVCCRLDLEVSCAVGVVLEIQLLTHVV